MAFAAKDLSVLAYANGFTLWHYTTIDLAGEVDTTGYFNDASDLLRVGDMILVNTDTDGAPAGLVMVASSNTNGIVSVCSLTETSPVPAEDA